MTQMDGRSRVVLLKASIIGSMMVLLLVSVVANAGFAYAGQSNVPLQNTASSGSVMEDAIGVPLYFNGSLYTGTMNFHVGPGSRSIMNVVETYPWTAYSSLSASSKMVVNLTLAPFPVTSVMPSWLNISLPSNPVEMTYGQNASFDFYVSVDNSIPALAGGVAIGSFELQSHYIDPVTGKSATELNVISITPSSSATNAVGQTPARNDVLMSTHQDLMPSQSQSNKAAAHSHKDPSWAIGVGLCTSSSTGQCNGYGIGWSSVNAIEATENDFTWGSGNGFILFTLNASPASGDLLQAELTSPYGGSGNWEYRLEYLTSTTDDYTYMWGEGSSGSVTLEILNDSGCTDGWAAINGATEDCYSSFVTHCCANTSTFYGEAQEPSAFESYDTTQADFSSKVGSFNPVFKYSTNDGSSWSNPPTGMLVNSGSDSNSWPAYRLGGGASTPTWFLEAGYYQCTASTYEVDVGVSSSICSGATNTYDTQLF